MRFKCSVCETFVVDRVRISFSLPQQATCPECGTKHYLIKKNYLKHLLAFFLPLCIGIMGMAYDKFVRGVDLLTYIYVILVILSPYVPFMLNSRYLYRPDEEVNSTGSSHP